MKWIIFLINTLFITFFSACNDTALPTPVAVQPLVYQDENSIEKLTMGYGVFGAHEVAIKSIPNTRYNYKPNYEALHLKTTLYYPKDLTQNRATIFFYSGYNLNNPNFYKGILYFIASKGYNVIFITCPAVELRNLPLATQDALDAFSEHIDTNKVGFMGHSMGAGVAFWMITQFPNLGHDARLLFPMASGYTVFNEPRLLPQKKTIQLPANTNMIQQVYSDDMSTDIRIGIDLFLHNSLANSRKDYMFLYGDSLHNTGHDSCMSKAGYDYNALMQRSIYRPLDALLDETFSFNQEARVTLKLEMANDSYFHPYIGKSPQHDIPSHYIHPINNYPYNCNTGGTVSSVRKDYCQSLGL